MKKFLFYLFIIFILNPCFGANYYIKNWDIDINIHENKLLNVTEKIDVYFKIPQHGYFRYIPLEKEIINQDGLIKTKRVKIAKIKATQLHEIVRSTKDVKIVCGRSDRKVIGGQSYTISYNYKIPFDEIKKNNDEFIYDIIGLNRNDIVKKAHFRITFPKEFDSKKIDFASGLFGSNENQGKVEYKVYSNTIEGRILKPLGPKEALTVIVKLPEGYFVDDPPFSKILAFLIITILSLIPFSFWFVFGKDDKVIPVVNFYPPKGLTSAEVGTIYRKSLNAEREIVSSILYLASRGYIKIINQEDNFTLQLIKQYDGNKSVEKKLMESLFKNYSLSEITKNELEKSRTYYKDCGEINIMLEGLKEKLYKKSSRRFIVYFVPILAIIGLLGFLNLACSDFDFSMLALEPSIFVFSIFVSCTAFIIILNNLIDNFDRKSFIFFTPVLLAILSIAIAIGIVFVNEYADVTKNLSIIIYGIIGIVVSVICVYQMPKKNKLALKLLGHIEGYKKFLKTAEQKRLQELMKENPYYCYDMVPYAYVLGIVKEWVEKFEGLNIENPGWYVGRFSFKSFNKFTTSMSDYSVPTTSNGGISKSSGGFSSRGGRSGGGFGGGGGGSW